jgi:hypothetical protein
MSTTLSADRFSSSIMRNGRAVQIAEASVDVYLLAFLPLAAVFLAECSMRSKFSFIVRIEFSMIFLSLAQRASTALRAASLRCFAVRFSAVAFPPLRPSATAAAFFVVINLLLSQEDIGGYAALGN